VAFLLFTLTIFFELSTNEIFFEFLLLGLLIKLNFFSFGVDLLAFYDLFSECVEVSKSEFFFSTVVVNLLISKASLLMYLSTTSLIVNFDDLNP